MMTAGNVNLVSQAKRLLHRSINCIAERTLLLNSVACTAVEPHYRYKIAIRSLSSKKFDDNNAVAVKNDRLSRYDLNISANQGLSILAFGDHCFQVNDILVRHSILLFKDHFLLWNANEFDDITIESLNIFTVLYPTIEILLIGCGEYQPKQIDSKIVQHFKSKGIVIEASHTSNAAATYNILISEERNVAAALLTMKPKTIQTTEDILENM